MTATHIQVQPAQYPLPRLLGPSVLIDIDRLLLQVDRDFNVAHWALGAVASQLLHLEVLPDALAVEHVLALRDDGILCLRVC